MILRKNQDLFNLVKALAGVNQFTSNEVTSLVNFTNRRLTTAYNTSQMWSRYVVPSEKRSIGSLLLSNFTSTLDQSFNDAYKIYEFTQQQGGSSNGGTGRTQNNIYQSINNENNIIFRNYNGNNTSDTTWSWKIGTASFDLNTDGTVSLGSFSERATDNAGNGTIDEPWDVLVWNETNGSAKTININEATVIPYTEENKTSIASFIRVHRKRAFLNDSSTEYDFFVDANGANILNNSTTDNVAYVTYKKHIIDTSTGTIITSLDINGSSNLQQIPLEFFNYTAHSVFADFLRLDGQTDKAFAEEQIAQNFLTEELEKVDIINNRNSLNQKFSTYINTSSR